MEEGVPPLPLQTELQALKLSDLKKRAVSAGVDFEVLCKADDVGDVKSAVIGLIMAAVQNRTDPSAELRQELGSMKLSAIKLRAKEVGVDEQKLIESDDADSALTTHTCTSVSVVAHSPRPSLPAFR
jgi:hypothetical protein